MTALPNECPVAQSAGAVEYTNCFSAEGYDSPSECPEFDTKQSDCEASVMLEPWGMRTTPSLPSLPGLLWPGVVAPERVLSMDQIEQNCYYVFTVENYGVCFYIVVI